MSVALGEFEQLILLALVRLGPDAYGATVRREIEEHAGREVSISAVYTTLERLEQKGLVRSRIGEPTPERGGRRRRHFELLPLGARSLARRLPRARRHDGGHRTAPENAVMTRLALLVIRLATPPREREWVVGDTVEELARIRDASGERAARRWLRREMWRVLAHAPRHRLAVSRGSASEPAHQ